MPRETVHRNQLCLSIGQYSCAGIKPINQDFHGCLVPQGSTLSLKGITMALADGISSSPVSQVAAETIVKAMMTDYYCTSDAWSVKTAAQKVITATHSWLYAQNRRQRLSDMNRAMVCTLSAVIFKGQHAHLFHVGDSRIWRLSTDGLEQLTQDHRLEISPDENYLARSIGSQKDLEIDYAQQRLKEGDFFLITTDGVHDFWQLDTLLATLKDATDLDQAAQTIIEQALSNGSDDNLTLQIAHIDHIADDDYSGSLLEETLKLERKALPKEGDVIDHFRIIRPLVQSARSHIFLAQTPDNQDVVLKFPSTDLADSSDYLRRFVMEEWISRRITSPHVLGAAPAPETRSQLYTVTPFIQGITLRQWMHDHPNPDLPQVRDILEQVANGLRAFHRKEMIHQDLRPENIMIDANGTVKIIDFGSTHVAGVQEISPLYCDDHILGTVQYSAPEYFLGYNGTAQSDLFSLGVIAYEMLTGKLPYGTKVNHIRTQKDLRKLHFKSTLASPEPQPDWIDFALSKAVHLDPHKRHAHFSEFLSDLKSPSPAFKSRHSLPLKERDPVLFWQGLTLFFALLSLFLFMTKFQ